MGLHHNLFLWIAQIQRDPIAIDGGKNVTTQGWMAQDDDTS
jgi:hypothetical protein